MTPLYIINIKYKNELKPASTIPYTGLPNS